MFCVQTNRQGFGVRGGCITRGGQDVTAAPVRRSCPGDTVSRSQRGGQRRWRRGARVRSRDWRESRRARTWRRFNPRRRVGDQRGIAVASSSARTGGPTDPGRVVATPGVFIGRVHPPPPGGSPQAGARRKDDSRQEAVERKQGWHKSHVLGGSVRVTGHRSARG